MLKKKVIQGGLDVQKSDGTSTLTVDETSGAATIGNSTTATAYPLTVSGSDSGYTSIPIKVANTTRGNIGASTTQCLRVINAAHTAENGSCTDAGAWALGPSGFNGTHTLYCGQVKQIHPSAEVLKGIVLWNTVANGAVAASVTLPNNYRGFIIVSQWDSVNGNVQTSTCYFIAKMGSIGLVSNVVSTITSGAGRTFTVTSSGGTNITITNTSGGNGSGGIVFDVHSGA